MCEFDSVTASIEMAFMSCVNYINQVEPPSRLTLNPQHINTHIHNHTPDSRFLMAFDLASSKAVTHLCLSTSLSARR